MITTTHRGVAWRRDGATIDWRDDDGGRWVRWRPGADAPPLPPDWDDALADAPPSVRRAPWRSPFRLVPVVLVVGVIVIGVLQATSGSSRPSVVQARAEAAAAGALRGRCLATDGTAGGAPVYAARPVPCSSGRAAVRVLEVRPPDTSPAGGCPSTDRVVRLAFPGVAAPHVLCVVPTG